jgi:hypothetical protein
VTGWGAAAANSRTILPLPSLVSNIMAGPLVPRASKFITRPICLASG